MTLSLLPVKSVPLETPRFLKYGAKHLALLIDRACRLTVTEKRAFLETEHVFGRVCVLQVISPKATNLMYILKPLWGYLEAESKKMTFDLDQASHANNR